MTSSVTLQKWLRPVVGSAATVVPNKRVKISWPPNVSAPKISATSNPNASPARSNAARARSVLDFFLLRDARGLATSSRNRISATRLIIPPREFVMIRAMPIIAAAKAYNGRL